MKSSTRAGLAALAVSGVLLAAAGCDPKDGDPVSAAPREAPAAATTAAAPAPVTAGSPYVALGDSYTAGPDIPDRTGTPAGCERSDRNYPSLVARELGISSADFRDMSCSGATIADLSAAQSTDDGDNPAQLSALSGATRLVTLGIGGNDIDFSAMIKKCVTAGVFYYATGNGKYTGDTPCQDSYVSGGTDTVRQKIDAAGEQLADALGGIRRRAPNAAVYVVGYPAALPSEAGNCGREMGLAPGDVTFLHQEQQRLNTMLKQAAAAAGAGYVDTYTPSVGHDACSARTTRWIEPMIPLTPAAPVHPNARGERGMADAVLTTLRS